MSEEHKGEQISIAGFAGMDGLKRHPLNPSPARPAMDKMELALKLEALAIRYAQDAVSTESWSQNRGHAAEVGAAYAKLAEFVRARASTGEAG